MLLEALSGGAAEAVPVSLKRSAAGHWICDWGELIPMLQDDAIEVAQRAAIFHESMAKLILDVARRARKEHVINRVGFSGGVFQNRLLNERAASLLEKDGFEIMTSTGVPVNDGGLSLGQIIEYGYRTTV